MAGHHVERLEVVPVVLDLGALHDAVAHAHEDVFQLALHLGDELEVPARPAVAAGGAVEPVAVAGGGSASDGLQLGGGPRPAP